MYSISIVYKLNTGRSGLSGEKSCAAAGQTLYLITVQYSYRAGPLTAKPIFCRTPRITLSMQCTVSTYHLGTVPSSPGRPERSRAVPGTSLLELRAVRSHAVAMWCTGPHEALTTSFFARS